MGYRPTRITEQRLFSTRRTIRRDNKKVQALTLPVMTNHNMCSFFPKSNNFCQDVLDRETDISFLTEVWQKQENKKHQYKLEEMLEMKGIKYISTPRPGVQRGGGAAIAVRLEKFSISKLNISIPRSVEVVCGLLKPKVVSGKIGVIIACCFYSPPRSKKNGALIDHITVTLQTLLITHRNAGVIISGDRNSIDIPTFLSIDPSLRQTVKFPTHSFKILDVIVTNLARYFDDPEIIPPILPDNPNTGAPSDHKGVLSKPNSTSSESNRRIKTKKVIRPLPDSLVDAFGLKLKAQNFNLIPTLSSTEMVQKFQTTLNKLLTETFPEKDIFISPDDQPHFNEQLRKLKRKRLREYSRHGKTEKYFRLLICLKRKWELNCQNTWRKLNWKSQKEGEEAPTLP